MLYYETHETSSVTTAGTISFYEIPINGSDCFVKHAWSDSAKSLSTFVADAPSKSGYTLYATVNGGAFVNRLLVGDSPHGSLQRFNSSGVWEEKADSPIYGDLPYDFKIENGKVDHCWINGEETNVPASLELVRSGFMFHVVNNQLGYDDGENSKYNNSEHDVITGSDRRIGIAFRDHLAYLIIIPHNIEVDIVRQICVDKQYTEYINLDGGRSVGFYYKDEEEIVIPNRNLHEAIYVYEKNYSTKTMRATMTKPTISPNRYPTRPSVNEPYNPSAYFINTGDVVVISDIKAANDGNVVCRIADCLTDGVSTDVLNGRWFVYDKNNFS